MLRNVKNQVLEARKAFIEKELLEKKLKDDKTTGWNNIVKECKAIKFQEKKFLLVEVKGDGDNQTKYYLVDEENLTNTILNYMRAFVEDYTDEEFVQDMLSTDEH